MAAAPAPVQSALLAGHLAPPPAIALGSANQSTLVAAFEYEQEVKRRRLDNPPGADASDEVAGRIYVNENIADQSPGLASAISAAVQAAVGPAVQAAVGPAVQAAVGPAVQAAVGPAVQAAVTSAINPITRKLAQLDARLSNATAQQSEDTLVQVPNDAGDPPPAWVPTNILDLLRMTGAQAAVLEGYYGLNVGRSNNSFASDARRQPIQAALGAPRL
eukprot:EG_transcript_27115